MNNQSRRDIVERHIRHFFVDHPITEHQWTLGPAAEEMPELRVLCVAPGNRTECWVYLSVGASLVDKKDAGRLEFFILAQGEDLRNVELVTLTAWYHKTRTLGLGHTLPIGEPWLACSSCDHLLVSLPYPFGPELEICEFDDGHAHLFWLLPITEAEHDFKVANDLETLEQLFEDSELEFWNPVRTSVV